ncbi:hypothetical protein ARMGADRAFT_669825 [Armillaria gallica]|uniref:Uncharacterized protein n=1 Tax=Armillaria gallica TaxID=47427 RepID=A0A2H3D346_ARMGA|nr:hypothetical protein ARMGADRAFT_669825 [Armillaria gallica]
MTRTSNLEPWIQAAKLGAAAGELAPFPYIKGLCGCAVVVLEAIEKAGKNNEDLLDLADSIGKTIEMVQNTVKEHGESSALRFHDVCEELGRYLTDLTFELNSTRRKSRGIKRLLKTKSVSDAIKGYQERVHTIKEDFLIRIAIKSGLLISDIQDGLRTNTDTLTSVIKMSQRHTDKNTDRICKEIHTWGVSQSQKADELVAVVQASKEQNSDKFRDLRRWEIYVKENLAPSHHHNIRNRFTMFDEYKAQVENSCEPKLVRIYCSHKGCNREDVLKQFHTDVDTLTNLEWHPHIAQIYGVCRYPDFPAIVFHGTTRFSIHNYRKSLTAVQLLHFYFQLVCCSKIYCILHINYMLSIVQ